MTEEACDTSRFANFWDSFWLHRIEEELQTLEEYEMSDADRRAAEEVGVQWCEPPDIEVENPFDIETTEYWLHELDMVCTQ
ncbi:hypothetical protein K456DRAFT_54349, partial [Colletotrichum gloeosporioides 23]